MIVTMGCLLASLRQNQAQTQVRCKRAGCRPQKLPRRSVLETASGPDARFDAANPDLRKGDGVQSPMLRGRQAPQAGRCGHRRHLRADRQRVIPRWLRLPAWLRGEKLSRCPLLKKAGQTRRRAQDIGKHLARVPAHRHNWRVRAFQRESGGCREVDLHRADMREIECPLYGEWPAHE